MVLLYIHVGLLAAVTYSDLRFQRVPRAWSALALITGLISALIAPTPGLHLAAGGALLLYGLGAWYRGQRTGNTWGGGDTWTLTYLGLLFGSDVLLVILLGYALASLVVWVQHQAFTGTVPLAGLLASVALVVLLVPQLSLDSLADQVLTLGVPTPETHIIPVPVSPRPTPTPHPATVAVAHEAAAAVAHIGLVDSALRPAQAENAARHITALAAHSPDPQQAAVLRAWAAALQRYAQGDTTALTSITRYSACVARGDYTACE